MVCPYSPLLKQASSLATKAYHLISDFCDLGNHYLECYLTQIVNNSTRALVPFIGIGPLWKPTFRLPFLSQNMLLSDKNIYLEKAVKRW